MKILIIRFSSLGDIILTSTFQRVIRENYPNATIHFLTKKEFCEVLQYSPYIDKVLTIEKNSTFKELAKFKSTIISEQNNYDIVFDLHNSLRSRYFRMGLASQTFSLKKPTVKKKMLVKFKKNLFTKITPINELYLETAKELNVKIRNCKTEFFLGNTKPFLAKNDEITIGIAPGAKHFTKRWLPQYYSALAKLLIERKQVKIIIFGSKEEQELCNMISAAIPFTTINLAGKLNILETAATMQVCNAMVCNDSALMHAANALEIPVVAIFGSTVKEFGFFPSNALNQACKEIVRVAEVENLSCRPCTTIGRAECPKAHFKCMLEITPDIIIQNLKELEVIA